jgi:hypothetical protein
MSISFACGQCGKDYEVPDELAGRRVRCKACGTVMRLPEASPLDSPDDDDGYALEPAEEPVGPPPARIDLLRPGAKIDVLRVGESEDDRLVLETRALPLLFRVGTGLLLFLLGIIFCMMLEAWARGIQQPTRVSKFFIVMPYAIVFWGLERISDLIRLGYRVTLDGPSRSLTVDRLGAWQDWPVDDLAGVVFVITTSMGDSWYQSCEAYVLDADGRAIAWLGRTRSALGDPRPLARAAIQAARVLDVPIEAQCKVEPSHEKIVEALHLVRSARTWEWEDGMPRIRYPIASHRTVWIIIGTLLCLATIRFMVMYLF